MRRWCLQAAPASCNPPFAEVRAASATALLMACCCNRVQIHLSINEPNNPESWNNQYWLSWPDLPGMVGRWPHKPFCQQTGGAGGLLAVGLADGTGTNNLCSWRSFVCNGLEGNLQILISFLHSCEEIHFLGLNERRKSPSWSYLLTKNSLVLLL